MANKFPQWLENNFLEWQLSEGGRKTLNDFARYLKVSQPTISAWLNGSRKPTGENIDKIAAKLGPEIYDILGMRRPDPQLDRLIDAYNQASDEQKEEIIRQVLRLIGFQPEDE